MWLNTVLLTRHVLRPAALAAAMDATVASVTSTCAQADVQAPDIPVKMPAAMDTTMMFSTCQWRL
jgi:hypothetical protein